MFAKHWMLVLVAVAVSSNPQANSNRKFIHRTVSVSPNPKGVPLQNVVKTAPPTKLIPRHTGPPVKVANCGQAPLAPASDSKIVGGTEASPHEFPWQVALYIDSFFFCSGSVISPEWVMTAAHCMYDAGSVQIVAGAHNLDEDEPSQMTMRSTDFFIHEDYNSAVIHNDIAMIHLPNPLPFNDYIQPVCLPTGADLGEDIQVTPSGWGKVHDGFGSISDVLNKVTVPTVSNIDCDNYYGGEIVTDNMICINTTGGMGTCHGDSGGPLNYKVSSFTEIRGITSFGSSKGCESDAPDSFTRVNHYLDWIRDHTGVTV